MANRLIALSGIDEILACVFFMSYSFLLGGPATRHGSFLFLAESSLAAEKSCFRLSRGRRVLYVTSHLRKLAHVK